MLTPVQKSQLVTSVFIMSKKECTVRFITDHRRFNHQLVRKTYSLPIIGDTVQQLEGFQYATALDINMGYYNIRIYPASQDMTRIVT